MAGERVGRNLGRANTGLNLYGVLRNKRQDVFNLVTFVTYTQSARDLGIVRATEQEDTGYYVLIVPAEIVLDGEYSITWFASPTLLTVNADTDAEHGLTAFAVGETLPDLAAMLFNKRVAGSGGSILYKNNDDSTRFIGVPTAIDGSRLAVVRP